MGYEELFTNLKKLTNSSEIIEALDNFLNEHKELEKKAKQLEQERDYYKELNGLRLKEKYAKHLESLKGIGYITLFDELELDKEMQENEDKIEAEKIKITYERKKRKNLVNEENRFEVREKHITINDEKLQDIHSDIVTRKLIYKKAEFYIEEIHVHQYVEKGTEDTKIIRADYKEPLFGKSMVSAQLINSIIEQRYILGTPLYRLEQSLKYQGVNLSRQDMSNYIYQAYNVYEPIIKLIKDYTLNAEVLHCDETHLQVLEINNKDKVQESSKQSYIWGVATGKGYNPSIYYRLGPTRGKVVAEELFSNDHHKYLMTDCYQAYNMLKNTTNVYCLVHVARKFKNAMKHGVDKSDPSAIIVEKIANIFHEDNKICEKYKDDYDGIKVERNLRIKPLFDDLYKQITEYSEKTLTNSLFGNAILYAQKAKEGVYNVLLDGRLELENNYAEREVIKPIIISRKNSLFANTKKGANVTCGLYTLLRTAVANHLNPYEYLEYLANNLPINYTEKFNYKDYLPWSETLPKELKIDK